MRPTGPWRMGPDTGARDGVDLVYHSDSLYSAVTGAIRLLSGYREFPSGSTLQRTIPPAPLSASAPCFLFTTSICFVIPPRTVWPPPPSTKVRWKGARFVPLGVVAPLLSGRALEEDRWDVDAASQCLVPVGRSRRRFVWARAPVGAAVDRLSWRRGASCHGVYRISSGGRAVVCHLLRR